MKKRIPFILLLLAIVVKFAWFYNMTNVDNNYLLVVMMTTVFYGGVIILLSKRPLLAMIFAGGFTFIFECEVLYFRYFNKLLSFYNLVQVRFVNSVSNVMLSLVRVGDIVLLLDLVLLFIILFKNKEWLQMNRKFRIITVAFMMLIIPSLTLAGFGNELGVSLINQEFFIYHARDGIEVYQSEVSEEETIVKKPPIDKYIAIESPEGYEVKAYKGIFAGKNLITIQVESLQDMVINKTYKGQEITPFINSIIEQDSFYFSSYYQQLAKGNTSDAEFSSHNSLYPSMESISYLRYKDTDFRGLPVLLKEQGYETIAFHGNEGSFWCREEAYPKQGIDQFYSEEKLVIDDVIGMGLTDKSLFRQGAAILDDVVGNFYGFFITITNHNPYELPEDKINLELLEEDEDKLFGHYLESVHYTDEALKSFYEDLQARGLLENSVIVIYGDHHGIPCMDRSYQERVTEFLGYEYDFDEMMNIPLIIHAPGTGISGNFDFVADQQDLLPTLVNLFDLDDNLNMMGQDLLNTDDYFVLFQSYMVAGSFIQDDIVFEMSRDGIYGHSRAWNRLTKEPVDLEACRDGYNRALYEIELSKYLLENNKVIRKLTQ